MKLYVPQIREDVGINSYPYLFDTFVGKYKQQTYYLKGIPRLHYRKKNIQ